MQGLRCSLISEVQRRDHRVGHQRRIVKVRKLDKPGAVRESAPKVGCSADRQSCLSDAAWPHESDQSGSLQRPSDLGKLTPTPYEAGRIEWKVAGTASRSGHDHANLRRPAVPVELRIINSDDMGGRLPAQAERMTHQLPSQRVQVTFVGTPPARHVARASGVSEVMVDGHQLSLVSGSFQPFLEALRGFEVLNITSIPTVEGGGRWRD